MNAFNTKLTVASAILLMALPTSGHAFGRRKPNPAPTPTPTPTATPTPTPTPTPTGTPGAFESLSIFYGSPSRKVTPWGDVRVLPEDAQFPQHHEYELAKRILREAPVLGCGYVPLGKEPTASIMYEWSRWTRLLTMDQFRADIQRWKAMGANCIFVDTAGKDYENTEARMMEAWTSIHAAGMQAIWNAWEPADLPWHRWGAGDHFLFESSQGQLRDSAKLEFWHANHPAGAKGYAVTTDSLSTAERRDLTDLYRQNSVHGIQWRNDEDYENE